MYIASIVLFLFVLPIGSVIVEEISSGGALVPILTKWFVFWSVGARLLVSGLRQTVSPQLTAESRFGIKGGAALPIVREVGMGNLAKGILGLTSIFVSSWALPAALVGGLFYAFAGVGHVFETDRNFKQNAALVTDLMISALLLALVLLGLS